MKSRNLAAVCTLVAMGIGISGCIPHKDAYRPPQMPAAPAWHTGLSEEQNVQLAPAASAATDVKWRNFYTDDKLRRVIDLTLKNNRDLRIAVLNVEKARAQYRLQKAGIFPLLSAAASTSTTHTPGEVTSSMYGAGNAKSNTYTLYEMQGEISSWEIDFFGRLRKLTKQQQELYLATEQGRSSTQVALIASVVNQYLLVASDRDKLKLTKDTVKNQEAIYELIRESRDHGIKSDLDITQARSQIEAAQADVAQYARQLNADEDALDVLAGTSVPQDLLPNSLGSELALKDISVGMPSEVLLHRPDILEAEHNLKSAYANIAAARAEYFPKITLTTNGGSVSAALTDLLGGGTAAWSFSPQLSLPIFDAGARKANYRVAQVERDTYLAEYEKSIQSAFQEVSDALNARTRLMEQEAAQRAQVKSLTETYKLTEARYLKGIDNYQNVLNAQRSIYSGQQSLLTIQYSRLSNLVTLYKVLGGGVQ